MSESDILTVWPGRRQWWPRWDGRTVVVAAPGPSLDAGDLVDVPGDARIIAVNRAWETCPSADVLYSGDERFWRLASHVGFHGLKVAGEAPAGWRGIDAEVKAWLPACTRLHLSGTQAIIFAAVWGAERIVLTGFDMAGPNSGGGGADWPRHLDGLARLMPQIQARGVDVVNASRHTVIPAAVCRRVTVGEAMANARG